MRAPSWSTFLLEAVIRQFRVVFDLTTFCRRLYQTHTIGVQQVLVTWVDVPCCKMTDDLPSPL